ncbi:MAG: hypothetical protein C7B44_15905 [Sulfobacillus thermosulfidooxidans]|nr:MAG: hypothetical protein C7B44_15905 [Sulfobacillus thermosulfidooxidans]
MATIRDVAQRAGVSIATVSHVINGTRPVAESTRAAVLESMRQLNFVPSALGRGLRTNSLKTIGFIAADLTNPFFAQVFRGVESMARNAHYTVIVSHSGEDVDREAESISNLIAKGVDGILLAPVRALWDESSIYTSIPVPVVTYDRQLPSAQLPSVVTDSKTAVFEAVSYFKARGHSNFALITGKPGLSTTLARRTGFEEACHDANSSIFEGNSRYEGGVQAAHWLASQKPQPTVTIVGNNLMAMGLVSTLQLTYPRILESTILVTLDEEPWSIFVRPALSVISQPTHDIGVMAAKLLLQKIHHEEIPLLTTLPCTFIPRGDNALHRDVPFETKEG